MPITVQDLKDYAGNHAPLFLRVRRGGRVATVVITRMINTHDARVLIQELPECDKLKFNGGSYGLDDELTVSRRCLFLPT